MQADPAAVLDLTTSGILKTDPSGRGKREYGGLSNSAGVSERSWNAAGPSRMQLPRKPLPPANESSTLSPLYGRLGGSGIAWDDGATWDAISGVRFWFGGCTDSTSSNSSTPVIVGFQALYSSREGAARGFPWGRAPFVEVRLQAGEELVGASGFFDQVLQQLTFVTSFGAHPGSLRGRYPQWEPVLLHRKNLLVCRSLFAGFGGPHCHWLLDRHSEPTAPITTTPITATPITATSTSPTPTSPTPTTPSISFSTSPTPTASKPAASTSPAPAPSKPAASPSPAPTASTSPLSPSPPPPPPPRSPSPPPPPPPRSPSPPPPPPPRSPSPPLPPPRALQAGRLRQALHQASRLRGTEAPTASPDNSGGRLPQHASASPCVP
eukprot:jgi/Botrbrau1/12877/Bobra.0188s0019.1